MKSFSVFYISSEMKPFSKVGGVADVCAQLPPALKKFAVKISVIVPGFGMESGVEGFQQLADYQVEYEGKNQLVRHFKKVVRGVPVHFLANEEYFSGVNAAPYIDSKKVPFSDDAQRYGFFSKACIPLIKKGKPDIVHCNDWPTSFVAGYLKQAGLENRFLLTVHNAGYQGNIGIDIVKDFDFYSFLEDDNIAKNFKHHNSEWNSINPMRLGVSEGYVNTVSPSYAKELVETNDESRFFEGGNSLEGLFREKRNAGKFLGILNGFSYKSKPSDRSFKKWMKEKQKARIDLASHFENHDNMLLGFVGRGVNQKMELLTTELDGKSSLEHLLDIPNLNICILASAIKPEYKSLLQNLDNRPNFKFFEGFNLEIGQQIFKGSDVFLMPSSFEPCGLTQMESMQYATVPLVRSIGGLQDTVIPHPLKGACGFSFGGSDKNKRESILRDLVNVSKIAVDLYFNDKDCFQKMQKEAFFKRFDWKDSAQEYIDKLYLPMLEA